MMLEYTTTVAYVSEYLRKSIGLRKWTVKKGKTKI